MLRRRTLLLLLTMLLPFSATYSNAQSAEDMSSQITEVAPMIMQYHADEGSLWRFYSIQNSPERRARLRSFYNDYLTNLKKLPFESLSMGGKVDYILFQRAIKNELYRISEEEREYASVNKLISYGEGIYELSRCAPLLRTRSSS